MTSADAGKRCLSPFCRWLVLGAALGVIGCHHDDPAIDGVPILLTVKGPAGTTVSLSPGGSTAHSRVVGTAPFWRLPVAHVGDTVVIEQEGLRYEESIQFGEPQEERIINEPKLARGSPSHP